MKDNKRITRDEFISIMNDYLDAQNHKIVLNSNTYKEVINKLGYKDNGGGVYTTLKKKINEFIAAL